MKHPGNLKEDQEAPEMKEKFEEIVDELRTEIIDGQKDELGRVSKTVKQSDNPREKLRKEIKKDDGEKDAPGDKVESFWQEEEIKYLLEKRKEMSNEELEEFFQRKSELHEMDFNPFSRTEEKLILQNYNAKTPEELASMLDREERVVKLKLDLMGLDKTPK